jgi:hypothetical protein
MLIPMLTPLVDEYHPIHNVGCSFTDALQSAIYVVQYRQTGDGGYCSHLGAIPVLLHIQYSVECLNITL